jgi:NADH:ubiquinone oxidoreductase subunit 6 (subunit J)
LATTRDWNRRALLVLGLVGAVGVLVFVVVMLVDI